MFSVRRRVRSECSQAVRGRGRRMEALRRQLGTPHHHLRRNRRHLQAKRVYGEGYIKFGANWDLKRTYEILFLNKI